MRAPALGVVAALLALLVLPGTSLAVDTVTASLVQVIATSAWSAPGSPDPSGVAWLPGPDRLIVVDSEVEEVTGAGYNGVNLWRVTRTGMVVDTGTLYPAVSKEPTGAAFDPNNNRLFVSDDSAGRIWIIRPGSDGRFGTGDDIVSSVQTEALYGSTDTEDPAYDASTGQPTSGHLFWIDGVNDEVYEVNPVNGTFGDGDDVMTHFDTAVIASGDWEGLAIDAARNTLLLGNRGQRKIYETTKSGTLLRTIDLSGISSVRMISGLTMAPASGGSGTMNYWVVDRGVDNGTDPNENDGRLIEVTLGPTSNQPPTAQGNSYSTNEDTTRNVSAPGVLANDSDPEGGALTAVLNTSPTHGNLTLNANGSFTYVPNANYAGSDAFTYVARDPPGAVSSPATVTLTITAVNDPPVVTNPGGQSDSEGDSVSLQVQATDIDGGSLTYSASGLPANLSINPSTGLISGTIAAGAAAGSPYSASVTANDGNGGSDTEAFTWTVGAPNDPPVAQGDGYSTNEDTTLNVNAPGVLGNDNDPDGGALTAVLGTGPTNGSLDLNSDGSFTYTPDADYAGSDSFTYRARDPLGALSAPATVSLTVVGSNDPPVVTNPGNRSNLEGANISLQVQASDVDGDTLTYGATDLPPGLSIDPTSGLISGTIAAGASAGSPYSASVTANDGNGGSDSVSFTWTITSNSPPDGFVGATGAAARKSGSITLNVPSGVQNGDLLVAAVLTKGTAANVQAPLGWELRVTTSGGSAATQRLYTRVADGSPSYTWTISPTAHVVAALAAYASVSGFGDSAGQGNSNSTLIRAPSVNAPANALLVGFFGIAANTSISPDPAMREAIEVKGSQPLTLEVSDDVLGPAGQTGVRTATASSSARNVGQVVVLLP